MATHVSLPLGAQLEREKHLEFVKGQWQARVFGNETHSEIQFRTILLLKPISKRFEIIPLTYPTKRAIIGYGRIDCTASPRRSCCQGLPGAHSVARWSGFPKCGVINEAYKLRGETTRGGLYKCAGCRAPFTVTMGTIFEDSHIPLHKWLFAIYLMCSSKKGVSAHQLWRNLWGVDEETGKQKGSYKTAWFMAHRIRWALGQEPMLSKLGGIVEIDEAYIGGKRRVKNNPGGGPREGEKEIKVGKRTWIQKNPVGAPKGIHPHADKEVVVSILQRDGQVRSKHIQRVNAENLRPMVEETVAESAHVMTDTSTVLRSVPLQHKHSQVNHTAKEYVRHQDGLTITTNTVEGYFGILSAGSTASIPRREAVPRSIPMRVRLPLQRTQDERSGPQHSSNQEDQRQAADAEAAKKRGLIPQIIHKNISSGFWSRNTCARKCCVWSLDRFPFYR